MCEYFGPFYSWVMANFPIGSCVGGQVADAIGQDEDFPRDARDWSEVEEHMRSAGYSGTLVAVSKHLFKQYSGEREDVLSTQFADLVGTV